MELVQLVINQQNGDVSGQGPGFVRSVRYSQPISVTNTATAGATTDASARLHFLRVDFLRGLTGNLHRRELSFHQRVQTVYGPVDAWDQELDMRHPESLPREAITMSCDVLTVNEDPLVKHGSQPPVGNSAPLGGFADVELGPIEMLAQGNVLIHGGDDRRGLYTARAERASYDQIKDTFVLEGDTLTGATIEFRQAQGKSTGEQTFRKITYSRRTGDFQMEGGRGTDLTIPPDAAFAPNPTRNQGRLR
jgi:hypothetical protein